MKKGNTSIADAVFNCLPAETKNALTVVSQISLPVHDKCSFDSQLDQMSQKADEPTRRIIMNLKSGFTARDFPILSLSNAVEKLWVNFRPIPRPIPRPIWPEFELPGDIRERPSVCSVYQNTFYDNPGAANCACSAYGDALSQGLTEYQAIIIGMQAGNYFRITGEC
ncbi:MAG: hypothetical protein JJU13_15300 [Balneolaceae bacterium]|nr:hypothetical protein [Balneolaceae bacterium]